MQNDEEHLRLLSIFHFVLGGMMILFFLFPLIHITLGLGFVLSPEWFAENGSEQPPAFVGWLLFIIGGLVFLGGQTLAICMIISGRLLAKRKNYMASFIIACVECLLMPLGTVLGVFSIITLSRESVKSLYNKK